MCCFHSCNPPAAGRIGTGLVGSSLGNDRDTSHIYLLDDDSEAPRRRTPTEVARFLPSHMTALPRDSIANHRTRCSATTIPCRKKINMHMHLGANGPFSHQCRSLPSTTATKRPSASWPDKLAKGHLPMKHGFRPPFFDGSPKLPFPPHPSFEKVWFQRFDFLLNAKIGNSVKIYQRRAVD